MANRTFVSLEPKLAASVPGCPRPTIIDYIRDIAREVCERTLVWRYEMDNVRLTAGVHEYEYDIPSKTEVVSIISATINGSPLIPVTQEAFHGVYPKWPSTVVAERSTPRFIGQFDNANFVLAPVPNDTPAYDAKLFVALKPALDAVSMEKSPFDECEQIILHGVLQHLLVLPNKSWSDRELATYHAKQYLYKTSVRRAQSNIGVARGAVAVRMRPLA